MIDFHFIFRKRRKKESLSFHSNNSANIFKKFVLLRRFFISISFVYLSFSRFPFLNLISFVNFNTLEKKSKNKANMNNVSDIISRIKDFCISHAVDVENELLSYDRKKNGIISTISLRRWIASIGTNLSSRAIQALIMQYQDQDGINVRKLIDDINNSASFNATISARPPTCTNELADLARELARRRQDIRDALSPYDRMNSGHVNANNFYRVFGASPSTKAIVEFYIQDDGIDYLRIANDLKHISKTIDTTQYTIPEPTEAFKRLAAFIKTREIDTRLAFSSVDRLNTGKMPRRQFYSVLSSFGNMISPSGLTEIANSFCDSGDLCNYNLFCQAVDNFVVPAPPAAQQPREIPEELLQAVDPQVLLKTIGQKVATRHIDVDSQFIAAQREYPGEDEISLNLFDRLVRGMHLDLQSDEINAVAALFKGPRGGVYYKHFCQAVKPQVEVREISSAEVVRRLKEHLTQTNQLLYPSAARFDREGSGEISVQQLMSALQFVRFDFTNQEIAALRDSYSGSRRGSIAWTVLCKECDPQNLSFRGQQQEQTTGINIQQENSTKYNPPPKNVAAVLRKVSQSAQIQGVDMISEFRAYDQLRRGYVNQQTFANFLYSLPCQLSNGDIRMLISFYRVTGSSDVNYAACHTDAKKIMQTDEEEKTEAIKAQPLTVLADTLPEFPEKMHSFLKRFKSYANQKRINASDLFSPYDVNHNGTIPIYKVQSGFSQYHFPATPEEVDDVINTFRSSKKNELFDYMIFVKAVEKEDISAPEVRASLASVPISAEIERYAQTTCNMIREKLLARHRKIDTAFAGIREPSISSTEFQGRLNSYDIVLTANQVQSLIRKYRVNLTNQIDYQTFINDVNNSKTI